MKISNPSLQQSRQVFMETFSNALNDDEESRIYDQAFDTFSRQAESGGASFDKVPTFLAAHTFNTAKSSLSALMPSAELPEIRAAAEEHPEVAKWVSLLDTSSEFLEAATEQHEGRDLACLQVVLGARQPAKIVAVHVNLDGRPVGVVVHLMDLVNVWDE